jgi:hypothetical protein
MSTFKGRHPELSAQAASLILSACVLFLVTPGYADEILMTSSAELYSGRLIQVREDGVEFDLECKGKVIFIPKSKYDGVKINGKCRGKTVLQPFGGEDDGCGGDGFSLKGAKDYVLATTKADSVYALDSSAIFDGDTLSGKLLLSKRPVKLERGSLNSVGHEKNCHFRKYRN